MSISVLAQSITETEEYQLERQATAHKQAGNWAGAIDCLTISATLHGFLTGRELGPDPKIRARVALLEDAVSRDDHPALVRHHVDRLAVALRERGVA